MKIPLSLLYQATDLLEYIRLPALSVYDEAVICDYECVLSASRKKKRSLDLRKSYARIIFSEDDDERFEARMRYLQEKRHIKDEF